MSTPGSIRFKAGVIFILFILLTNSGFSQVVSAQNTTFRRISSDKVSIALFYIIKGGIHKIKPMIEDGTLKIYSDSSLKTSISPKMIDSLVSFTYYIEDSQEGSVKMEQIIKYYQIKTVIAKNNCLQFCAKLNRNDIPYIQDTLLTMFYIPISQLKNSQDEEVKTIFYDFIYEYSYVKMHRDTTNRIYRKHFGIDIFESFLAGYKNHKVTFYENNWKEYEQGETNNISLKPLNPTHIKESLSTLDLEYMKRDNLLTLNPDIEDDLEIFVIYKTQIENAKLSCSISQIGNSFLTKYPRNTIYRQFLYYSIEIDNMNQVLPSIQGKMFVKILYEVLYNPALAN